MYTKPSAEELRVARARPFFDDDRDADDATVAPDLVRRARLVTLGQDRVRLANRHPSAVRISVAQGTTASSTLDGWRAVPTRVMGTDARDPVHRCRLTRGVLTAMG